MREHLLARVTRVMREAPVLIAAKQNLTDFTVEAIEHIETNMYGKLECFALQVVEIHPDVPLMIQAAFKRHRRRDQIDEIEDFIEELEVALQTQPNHQRIEFGLLTITDDHTVVLYATIVEDIRKKRIA